MALAFLTLLTGLAISAVAIYYSVIGLAAIFSAAVIPIIVMGAILEVSKLVSAWWLKANWHRAPFLLKSYMLIAVVVLMLITSMGIFGFLSKAHTDQAIMTGDVQSQVYLIDEQIKIERENIANAQSLIKQLDDAVIGIQAAGNDREIKQRDGSTVTQSSAERALQVRRAQARDRAALTKQIEEAQQKIIALQQKKAPIAANMREVEAKVGPIKYIAQLIYGQDPDENLLEKAVTWVIITIVFVFDPLAVLLLLASQMSFQWARQEKEERKNELVQTDTPYEETPDRTDDRENQQPDPESRRGDKSTVVIDQANEGSSQEAERVEPQPVEETVVEEKVPEVEEVKRPEEVPTPEKDDDEDEEATHIKAAKQAWKMDNPEGSIKHQRRLLELKLIDELPWNLPPYSLLAQDDAALEAAKWAQEQIEKSEDSKKKDSDLDGERRGQAGQEDQGILKGYIQNAEQSGNTLWKKVQDAKGKL